MEYKILTFSEFERWIDSFCDLYKKCFTAPINENIVRWRYFDNPYKDLLVCVAIDKGQLVASYAALPLELICCDHSYKAALSVNAMTDPDYMGRGLCTTLAKRLFNYMEKQHYHLTFGFPNYLLNRTYVVRLTWTILYEIPSLELKLPCFKKPLSITDNIIGDEKFLNDYTSCLIKNKPIYVHKTGRYLKWRYDQNPLCQYKNFVIKNVSGIVRSRLICKEYQEKLNIVDYCFADAEDIESLLCYAIEYATSLKKEKVTAWSQLGTMEHLVYEKLGFRNNYPITYFGVKVLRETNENNHIHDFRNWSIHAGDDNVY